MKAAKSPRRRRHVGAMLLAGLAATSLMLAGCSSGSTDNSPPATGSAAPSGSDSAIARLQFEAETSGMPLGMWQ